MKKVLVIMSSYNGEKYIEEQIKSIFNQLGDFKISLLIRDDGSSDNTIKIIKEFAKKFDVKWYKGENLKPAKSFVDLMYMCSLDYDYYAFADQDDYWENNKISKAIEFLSDYYNSPTIYYSNVEIVDKNLNSLGRNLYKRKPYTNIYNVFFTPNYIGCSMVWNKKLMQIVRKYEKPKIVIMHDSYLVKICKVFGGDVLYDNHSYVKYRQHGNNVIGSQTVVKEKLKRYLGDVFNKSLITVDEQTKEIVRICGKDLPTEILMILESIVNYKKCLFNRIYWFLSFKIKYSSISAAIKYKLEILLGNR